MKKNYYLVQAKCGHVGLNYFIPVVFGVRAISKSEAANITRWLPRVKHHLKDAIINIEEVSKEKYKEFVEESRIDGYKTSKSIQEQRIKYSNYYLDRIEVTKEVKHKKRNSAFSLFKQIHSLDRKTSSKLYNEVKRLLFQTKKRYANQEESYELYIQ